MSDDELFDDYLFDPKAPVDPEVQRIEQALARFRRSGEAAPIGPAIARRRRRTVGRLTLAALSAAATLLLVVEVARRSADTARRAAPERATIDVALQECEGSVRVNDASHAAAPADPEVERRLRPGDRIFCDAGGRARVKVGDIGWLTLEENTRLRVTEGRSRASGVGVGVGSGGEPECEGEGAYRLDLERGTVSALIFAAPRLFWLGTPSGIAVDLGCVYRTTVDDEGHTTLAVTRGRVSFESDGRKVYVPAGAFCRAWPDFGPGTPAWEDASESLRAAVIRHDEARMHGDGETARLAVKQILDSDQKRDSLTLWHLLDVHSDPESDLRAAVCDRLADFCPPPDEAPRDRCLAGDRDALKAWREKIESECW